MDCHHHSGCVVLFHRTATQIEFGMFLKGLERRKFMPLIHLCLLLLCFCDSSLLSVLVTGNIFEQISVFVLKYGVWIPFIRDAL